MNARNTISKSIIYTISCLFIVVLFAMSPFIAKAANVGRFYTTVGQTVPADDTTVVTAATYEQNVYVTRVYIGADVKEIAEDSFVNLHKLWLIQVDEKNPYFSTYGNCLYNKDRTKLLCVPFALTRTQFPDTVTEVGAYALRGRCDHTKALVEKIIKKNKGE